MSMPYDQWLPLILLALTMSFTPGPNNTIATVTAVNFGFRAVLPHAAGVPCGFGTMLLAATAGIAALLLTYPTLTQLLKWLGIGYLLWLAWRMLRADPVAERGHGLLRLPLSFT